MKLSTAKITENHLNSFTEAEKILFVQLSNLFHEINILQRMLLFSNRVASTYIETTAQNSQTLFFIEILAGKLCEGWELLRNKYYGTKLSEKYDRLLNSNGKSALEKLKDYFNNENLVKKIRDRYAFHYSKNIDAEILQQFKINQNDENHDIFLPKEDTGNYFFAFAEIVVLSVMLKEINPDDQWQALEKLFKEVTDVAKWFLDFLNSCIAAIMEAHAIAITGEIEIQEPPSANEVKLPFFIRKS